MATQKQIRANRENGKKGGPKTPEGKAIVRLNPRKHGIFSSALTEHDQEEIAGIHGELVAWFQPVGPVEGILVEKLAHTYLRLQRCARAEAEYHHSTWEMPINNPFAMQRYVKRRSLSMHASYFDPQQFERSVKLFSRYDTTLTNQLVKLLREIERLQRMRFGENVPPPLAADITLHAPESD